jgi:hydroxymethylbilane synthase
MARPTIRLATRTSRLALAQTEQVATMLHEAGDLDVEMVPISTRADRDSRPLQQVGARGMFALELEQALLAGDVDAAVHSCKDLALEPTPGLAVAAWLPRADARDVICGPRRLEELPADAVIATSSARRTAALRSLGSRWSARPIRGNVETRLRLAAERGDDGCMLAEAGLQRLGLNPPRIILDVDQVVPEPAQGVIVVQTIESRANEQTWLDLNDDTTRWCATIEREVALALDGGCELPIGVHVDSSSDAPVLHWFVSSGEDASQQGALDLDRDEDAASMVEHATHQIQNELGAAVQRS